MPYYWDPVWVRLSPFHGEDDGCLGRWVLVSCWRRAMTGLKLVVTDRAICFLVFFATTGEPMAKVLKLDEIKNLVDIPQLIQDTEAYQ